MVLVKTFFIKLKHYILLSQLRNETVNYLWHLQKNHHCPLSYWIFWQQKEFPLKKKIHSGDRTAHCPVLCILLVENADWAWTNQAKPITEGLYYKLSTDHLDILLGQCTLVLLDYNPLNHMLYSYHRIDFYYIKSILIICTKFHSVLGSANANKTWVSSTQL